MHILPQNLSDISLNAIVGSLGCLLFISNLVNAEEFDFANMLGGYGEAGYGEEMREKVRSELNGREGEIWAYVKDSFFNGDGISDRMAITAGIRALHDLNGYSEEILREYAEILEAESYNVAQLNDVMSRTTPAPGVTPDPELREYRRATKALGLIRSSFFVFKSYGNGLTHEMVSRLLHLNDGEVQTRVAGWYKANGTPSDIPVLEARADELKALGDQPGSDLVLSAIQQIESGSTAPALGSVERGSTDAPSTAAEQPSTIAESATIEASPEVESPSSSRTTVWPYVLVAVALVGIVVVLVRSRKGNPGR